MNLVTLLIVVLLIVVVLGLPTVGAIPHAYGYAPSSIVGVILVVLVILLLLGRL